MPDTVTTYRGRTLEELLPQVREQLGPAAVVLARREGLEGGVGGFFQRPFVEVDAVAGEPAPGVMDTLRAASRQVRDQAEPAATAPAPAAPAVATAGPALYGPQPAALPPLDEVAAAALADRLVPATDLPDPFAATLAAAERAAATQPEPVAPSPATEPLPAPASTDPMPAASAAVVPAHTAVVAPAATPVAPAAALAGIAFAAGAAAPARAIQAAAAAGAQDLTDGIRWTQPAPPAGPTPAVRKAAEALVRVLTDAGVPHGVASDSVAEAVTHGLAFGSQRQLKTLVRAALARRLPTLEPLGTGPRTVVVVGGSGAGKTTAANRLAAAYGAAGQLPVRVLGPDDPALREPFEGLTVVDTPAIRLRDTAAIATLAGRLDGLRAEVHVAVPATHSAAAAADLIGALAPLRPTHALVTHADETAAPGAAVVRSVQEGLRLSYVSGADALEPADALSLAKRLI